MIDRKENQDAIVPVNRMVLVKFVGLEETTTESGVAVPTDDLNGKVNFKGDKIYKVEILEKSKNAYSHLRKGEFAIIHQLSGFGIPTVEEGYCKLVRESEILMTSKDREFTLDSIVPEYGRALVKITSDKQETESGVAVPEGASMNSNWEAATLGGPIVKIAPGFGRLNTGDERDEENVEVAQVGDHVRFDAYMGTDLEIDGERYRMVLLSEILCKVKQ